MSDEIAEPTAVERLQAAQDALAGMRVVTPKGIVTFSLPAEANMAAAVDGLARLMLDKGIVTEEEFVEAKTVRLAELTEEMLEQAREVKRRASGLVLPGPAASA